MGIQQDVIKKFVKSLDNSSKYGISALNEAVNYASDGLFTTWSALVTAFVRDVSLYGGSGSTNTTALDEETDSFLKTYCGIDLTNDDTGAITGYDTGGSDTQKNAEDIVPESGNTTLYPTETSTTYNGVKITWPTIKTSSYSDKEKEIITGLYTWWFQSALDLVEESIGLSFNESDVISKKMTITFTHYATGGALASANLYNITINTPSWSTLDITGGENSGKKLTGSYFDRVLAHEMTHAIISTNVTEKLWDNSLVAVDEGLAELVHGADDGRKKEIVRLAQSVNASEVLEPALYYDYDESDYYDSYAAGYMLFRYLAKQTEEYFSDTISPFDGTAVVDLSKANSDGMFIIDSSKTGKASAVFITSSDSFDSRKQTEIGTVTSNNSYSPTLNLAQNITAKNSSTDWTIAGTSGNDSIIGGSGSDSINGGEGSDTLSGNAGNDSINGDDGNDSINGGAGDDYINGGAGADVILGSSGNDTINGDSGNDSISGSNGNDYLNGGDGDDKLIGGKDSDTLTGGSGNDTFFYATGDGDDWITDYTEGSDVFKLTSGSVKSSTVEGSDVILKVGSGSITFKEARGKYITVIDSAGNITNEVYGVRKGMQYDSNETVLTLTADFTGTLDSADYYSTVQTIDASSRTSAIKITGNTLNNSIKGGSGNDTLSGGKGADTLTGGSGKDVFVYATGDGKDVITDYNSGVDSIKLTSGSITKSSLSGSDVVLRVGSGSITLKNMKDKEITVINSAGTTSTKIYGNSSNSSTAAPKTVTLDNSSSSPVSIALPTQLIDASSRTNQIKITANILSNTIKGGSGADTIYGGAGNDSILGNKGNDKLFGQTGNDTLIGGKGDDTLNGGAGADVFVYSNGDGNDWITDYSAGQDSIKLLSGTIKSASLSGSNVVLKVGSGSITLKDAADKSITVIDSAGNTTSSVYGSSKNFAEEHWFLDNSELGIRNSELDSILDDKSNFLTTENNFDKTNVLTKRGIELILPLSSKK